MSTEEPSSLAQAAKVNNPGQNPDDEAPGLQDVLAQKTLAMLGGAPQPEVDRLATSEKANLDQLLGSSPDADQVTPSPASRDHQAEPSAAGPDANPDRAGQADDAGLEETHSAAALRELEALRDIVLAETVKQYPDLGNRDSALRKVAAQMALEAHDPSHPDHLAGQQVDAPRYFAEKAAGLLRIRPLDGRSYPVQASAGRGADDGRSSLRPGPASGSKQTMPQGRGLTEQQKVAAAQARTLAMIGGKAGTFDDDPGNAVLVM